MSGAPPAPPPEPDLRPIALVGLRASGKSTLGRLLATRLCRAFVDLDDEIAREDAALRGASSQRPAGLILAAEGEPRFRDLEERALERVLSRTEPLVLATGGGVVERARNRLLLRTRARCVWLQVPVEELQRRMRADPTPRPALLGGDPLEEVASVLQRRRAWFQELEPRVLACAGRAEDLVNAVLLALEGGPRPAP
ncbi:MAG: shikimate kinase [Planctomycetes bacterium]|nr:shikimate kinase [Planctomycetota bacterium]